MRCRELTAEYQPDYQAIDATPPLARADEWSGDCHRRLLLGLQRRLSPRNELADLKLFDEIKGKTFDHFAREVRKAAADEAQTPSVDNLPKDGSLVQRRRVDDAGRSTIEWFGRESFIKSLGAPARRAVDGSRRAAPFAPYLFYVPDDFALSLAFAGGGIGVRHG